MSFKIPAWYILSALYLMLYQLKLYGDVSVADVIPVIVVFLNVKLMKRREIFALVSIFLIYLFVQVFVDLFNQVLLIDVFKNIGRVSVIFVYCYCFIVLLNKNIKEAVGFIFTILLSEMLFGFSTSFLSAESFYSFWRHGVGESITLLFILFSFRYPNVGFLSLLIICAVNFTMDFRGMAALSLVALIVLYAEKYKEISKQKKEFFIVIIVFISLFSSYKAIDHFFSKGESVELSQRAETSNLVRKEMLTVLLIEMVSPNLFGNGYQGFKVSFIPPQTGNTYLDEQLSEGLPSHGYMLTSVYEVGKLALLCWLLVYFLSFKALIRKATPGFFKVLLIYFVYGSFMLTSMSFDKYLIAISLGILFYYGKKVYNA